MTLPKSAGSAATGGHFSGLSDSSMHSAAALADVAAMGGLAALSVVSAMAAVSKFSSSVVSFLVSITPVAGSFASEPSFDDF